MKKIALVSLLFLVFNMVGQVSGTVSLNWNKPAAYRVGNASPVIPTFDHAGFHYDATSRRISLELTLQTSGNIAREAVSISNPVFESVTAQELGDLNPQVIGNTLIADVNASKARSEWMATISISPVIKEGNSFRRLKSFTYSIDESAYRPVTQSAAVAAVGNSVLASGNWYRFYVEKSGVYKLSRGFLQSLGLSTSADPRNLKIYGGGGRMLPLSNATPYPYDIPENAIQVIGEEDGTFDSSDYVLFYAEGVDNWNDESQTHNNLYANRAYYYVTFQGGPGKRITAMDPMDASTPSLTINTFDDWQYHERDLINVVRTGRRWFGEQFGIQNEGSFTFNFPNIDTSSPIQISVYGGAAAFTPTSLAVTANGQQVGTLNFGALTLNSGVEMTWATLPAGTTIPASATVNVSVTYNNNGVPTSKGFLDYIILRAKRNLTGYDKQFRFQYNDAASQTGVGLFQLSNASSISQVWDITDIYNVSGQTNPSQANFSFKAPLGEVRKYIAVVPSDYYSPLKESNARVANQNLKGTIFTNAQGAQEDVDYLIITPNSLYNQAERLANFHRNYSGLRVRTVRLDHIYQEFSSGKQDVAAIRNFIRYVYENASSDAARVKYVNLFGDASFDYKDRIPNNTNLVPIYHSLNSFTAGEASFSSDDFFGLMDPSEGNVISFFGGIDIAVGRMIATNAAQAKDLVDKVIDYHDIKSYGNWRNNIVHISDDSDKPEDASLQLRQNNLSDAIIAAKPFINVRKIFLDAYVQESSAGGSRYPKARADIFNAFEKGALVFNYLGHGGEDGLSGERIWEKSDGENLSNRYRYPLFITITCDFSRYDNPYRPTAGEYTYWNPTGGAISMITTIRSIGQFSAENFNDRLAQFLFGYGLAAGLDTPIADALRRAKNSSPNASTNVVHFLGDPAMYLALPKPRVKLTKVNDMPVTGPIDDFQSLAYVKLSGQVTDENDQPLTGYNGELAVNIFDKPIARQTLNNDGNAAPLSFTALGETIFRGNASVTGGQFEFGFVVPRDIRIPVDNGRISFYAKRNQILLDKTGYNTDIKIGGINPNAAPDNTGPTVRLYMNDQTFVNGGITNASPIFLAFLEDENGINTASGIGHDIVAILDGDESNPYILNDYYETELDDYTKGKVRFPFRNLEKGLHTITFKAWDVYNNPITAEIQFVVAGDDGITLKNVLNYPNPFVNYTQFWFSHNRPFEPLEVQVQVITVTGKVVWTRNQVVTTDGFLSRDITWDGRDDFGDRIGKGVYIYKLTVRSTVTNSQAEKYEKLVIL